MVTRKLRGREEETAAQCQPSLDLVLAAPHAAAAAPAAARRKVKGLAAAPPAHPPVTMKTSMKKEPMAEAMVSVLHTHAMAWNSEVALPGVKEGVGWGSGAGEKGG